jgi:hypothetical protein
LVLLVGCYTRRRAIERRWAPVCVCGPIGNHQRFGVRERETINYIRHRERERERRAKSTTTPKKNQNDVCCTFPWKHQHVRISDIVIITERFLFFWYFLLLFNFFFFPCCCVKEKKGGCFHSWDTRSTKRNMLYTHTHTHTHTQVNIYICSDASRQTAGSTASQVLFVSLSLFWLCKKISRLFFPSAYVELAMCNLCQLFCLFVLLLI